MVKLYTAATPNGRKVSIALEELGVAYETTWVKLDEGQQNTPEFLALNPNAKIPIIDDDGLVVWESGAILVHLAEKFGGLLPDDPTARAAVFTHTFFQAAHLGPNLGRLAQQFYRPEGERNDEMVSIFFEECLRVFRVYDSILDDGREFLAGELSIADVMAYPWMRSAADAQSALFDAFGALSAWMDRMAARPAVARGMTVPS